jgi:hypothetical protein
MYDSGGVLVSKRRRLSVLARACVVRSSLSSDRAAALTHGLQKHNSTIRQTSVDASCETPFDTLAECRHAVKSEYGYDVRLSKGEAFESVDAAVSESTPTVESFRHLGEEPHLFIPAARS